MKRPLLYIFLALILGGLYIYKFQPALWNSWRTTIAGTVAVQFGSSDLLPPPLRGGLEGRGNLTKDGVINATNGHRVYNNELELHDNDKLDAAANAKLQDMFAKQYFEHVSPDGTDPAALAKNSGYAYVMVGENLALGNFENDAALVDAWMNSPGHRANILNKRFQEIGVAVGRGMFEGHETWLAVQEFGTPLSVCPQPSDALKKEIATNQGQINGLQNDLENKKKNLDTQAKVDAYNAEVSQVNSLIDQTKELIGRYNQQIGSFNDCLSNG